jgi:hypothetical protein
MTKNASRNAPRLDAVELVNGRGSASKLRVGIEVGEIMTRVEVFGLTKLEVQTGGREGGNPGGRPIPKPNP